MNRIAGIIDMDGFVIEKKSYCKEIGLLNVAKDEASSYIFDLGLEWRNLSEKDQYQCLYLTKKIHKLPFYTDRYVKALRLSELNLIVESFYNDVKTPHRDTLAYKGGHFEKDLLNALQIPSINLEILGCPKACNLFDRLAWLETCGNHIGQHSYQHCPKVEVEAFGVWRREETSNIPIS